MDRPSTYDGTDRSGTDSVDSFFDLMRRSMMGPSKFEGMKSDSHSDANLTVERTENGFLVIADVPGFETDEIDLRFDDGMLVISATRDVESEDDGVTSRRRRSVQERLRVPGDVDEDAIRASYHNGVLEVELPMDDGDDDSTRIDID